MTRKDIRIIKLDIRGFSHVFVMMAFVVLFAIGGVAYMVASHAEPASTSTTSHNSTSSTPPLPSTSGTIPTHYWIMTNAAFNSIIADPTASARLKNDVVYLIGGSPQNGFNIIPTISVTDVTQLSSSLANRASYLKAVIYDDEDWSFTPVNQISTQAEVTSSYKEAAQLVHAAGLQLIGTPALDITEVQKPTVSCGSAAWQEYLCDNLPNFAAHFSDVIDIQAQSQIQNQNTFLYLIERATARAKQAHPSVLVLAGLSTCQGSPTASQLAAAAVNSNPYVSGWWMNVPANPKYDQNCGSPDYAMAIQAIDSLPWY